MTIVDTVNHPRTEDAPRTLVLCWCKVQGKPAFSGCSVVLIIFYVYRVKSMDLFLSDKNRRFMYTKHKGSNRHVAVEHIMYMLMDLSIDKT